MSEFLSRHQKYFLTNPPGLITNATLIRQGKGRKHRTVLMARHTRRALRANLKERQEDHPALWVTDEGERLSYWGLRPMIKRRSDIAGIEPPSLHSFRRTYALEMLRAGVDVLRLQKLMGHADLLVLRRYLALTTDDIAQARRWEARLNKVSVRLNNY